MRGDDMNKMDKTVSRTPSDTERKFNLGGIDSLSMSSARLESQIQQTNQRMTSYEARMGNIDTGIEELNLKIDELLNRDYGGSGGIEYTSISYNEDDTITLTDTDGAMHTMTCTYDDVGKLIGATYDGKEVDFTYDGYALKSIGETAVNFENVPSSSGGGTEELEQLIDESGVLDSTEGTVTEKVGELIDKASLENYYYEKTVTLTNMTQWFANYDGKKLPRSKPVKAVTVNNYAFNSTIEEVDYYLDFGAESTNTINASNAFGKTKNLKHIVGVNTSKCYNVELFFDNSAIEVIDMPIDLSSITSVGRNRMFNYAYNLREVRFVENTIIWAIVFSWSDKLSAESIQSIIDGLATVETAQTLTLNSAITLTDEQKATINAKGWTLAQ